MPTRVTTAAEAAARDAAAIAAGTTGDALMAEAGRVAAQRILALLGDRVSGGVAIYGGAGNNGGDGWVVAAELMDAGVEVRVDAPVEPRTATAQAAAARARASGPCERPTGFEAVIVDAVLGIGSRGAPRDEVREQLARLQAHAAQGARVVALDLPSGLDADSGHARHAVRADLTLTFGTLKRGLLRARATAGEIEVLDIGLGDAAALADGAGVLVDAAMVREIVPLVSADANKWDRKRVLLAGGTVGASGAAILMARGALHSGVGMVRVVSELPTLTALASAEPAVMGALFPEHEDGARTLSGWCDAMGVGPGLGTDEIAWERLVRLLDGAHAPLLLDADALTLFALRPERLRAIAVSRPVLLTPHVRELARLLQIDVSEVEGDPVGMARLAADRMRCTVLLKGVPTIIASPDGRLAFSARGSAVLGTAGSGDVLTGMATTLLAQTHDLFASACAAAWVHGVAGELVGAPETLRGATLADVVGSLRAAWALRERVPRGVVLAQLPALAARR